jgi:hypothetical protein
MILEVYYRHLPLYGWKSVEFDPAAAHSFLDGTHQRP